MTQYRKSKFFASGCKSYSNLHTFGLLYIFMVMLEAENYDFIVLLWISFIIFQNLNLPYYARWIFWVSLFWNTVKFGNIMIIRNTFLECLLWWADSRVSPGLVFIKSEISPFYLGVGGGGVGRGEGKFSCLATNISDFMLNLTKFFGPLRPVKIYLFRL